MIAEQSGESAEIVNAHPVAGQLMYREEATALRIHAPKADDVVA